MKRGCPTACGARLDLLYLTHLPAVMDGDHCEKAGTKGPEPPPNAEELLSKTQCG